MQLKHNQKGLGLIGWIFIIPVILIGLLVLGVIFCEINKAYWDHKVRQWCEKDGGVTVYEKVELTREEYKKNDGKGGAIVVPSGKSPTADKHDYVWFSSEKIINGANPKVRRMEYITYRKADKKILAKMVIYSRSGGDAFIIDAGTSFSCADMKTIPLDVERQTFSVAEE